MKQSFAGLVKPTTPFFRSEDAEGPEGLPSRKYVGPNTYTSVIAASDAPAAYVATVSVLSGMIINHGAAMQGQRLTPIDAE